MRGLPNALTAMRAFGLQDAIAHAKGDYLGRNVACPYRCALDSKTCAVDVLVEEINKPRARMPVAPKWKMKKVENED